MASWRTLAARPKGSAAYLVAGLRANADERNDMENVQYPADWLAEGGPSFESLGLRTLAGPLTNYAALTLVRCCGVWKVVAGENNTVLAEADYENVMEYIGTYAWWVEHAERQAARS